MNSKFTIDRQNLLNPWYQSELFAPIEQMSVTNELRFLTSSVIRSTRIAQACVHLQNGDGKSEHHHFGDVAGTLLRVSLEVFVNVVYLYYSVQPVGKEVYLKAVDRFVDYAEIQRLKLLELAEASPAGRPKTPAGELERKKQLAEFKLCEDAFRAKYCPPRPSRDWTRMVTPKLDAFDRNFKDRLKASMASCPYYIESGLLEFGQAALPLLNSRIHSDEFTLGGVLGQDEHESRRRRLAEGSFAQSLASDLNKNVWRILAHRLGRLEDLMCEEEKVVHNIQLRQSSGPT